MNSYSWMSILPPVLVLVTIILTRRMILSFLVGITSSALIVTQGSLLPSLHLILQRFKESSGLNSTSYYALLTNWNISIFIFLLSLGMLIALLQHAGSTDAFVQLARRKITKSKSVETTSLLLSLAFFIDDYFSALTVGSVMRPLAALYNIHPVKAAFLVVAMASPLTILSPLSSWVGEIIIQLKQVGISNDKGALILGDPFYVFLQSIPLIFYALLMIIAAWYIVLRGISYGPMAGYESQTLETSSYVLEEKKSGSLFTFIFPLFLLISLVFIILLITGGYTLTGKQSFVEALKNGSMQQAFLLSGIASVSINSLFFVATKRIAVQHLGSVLLQGAWLMIPSMLMLIHAWTLSALLKQDLHTGNYIASLFSSLVSIRFFPVICFITSGTIAWIIGSAWASMGLMFPIVIPMATTLMNIPHSSILDKAPLVLPIIGATLSGCIIGTHLSFLADNAIMAAASSGASHFELVKAMIWYVLPVGIATALAYVVVGLTFSSWGFVISSLAALLIGCITLLLLFEGAQMIENKKHMKKR